jgi:hypothetical protein
MRDVVAVGLGVAAGVVALGVALSGSKASRRVGVEPPRRSGLQREVAAREVPGREVLAREVPAREVPAREVPVLDPVTDARDEEYLASSTAPFGPYHGIRRPSGLPLIVVEAVGNAGRIMFDGMDEAQTRREAVEAFGQRFKMSPSRVHVHRVRHASARGAAIGPVAEQATRHGHGHAFVKAITQLARTEGEGGTFGVAARNFNAGCATRGIHAKRLCTPVDVPRPPKSLITAWGVFQWNRDAGRLLHALNGLGLRAPPIPGDWMPWDWTAAEEIVIPINYYAQLWALVRRQGGSELDAARGVRLWHTGPSRFRKFLNDGVNAVAWTLVPRAVAEPIDKHLKNAGIA